MTAPLDDLPRSPTGRVPQWVRDEAAGRVVDPGGWRTPSPVHALEAVAPRARRRRRRVPPGAKVGLAAVLVLGTSWWVTAGYPGLPADVTVGLGPAGSPFAPAGPGTATAVDAPSDDVAALAEEAHLTQHGRELLYGARPELLAAEQFVGRCPSEETDDGEVGALGCYHRGAGIVLYAPPDPRLRGMLVETAAHELLHAAWDSLGATEQAALDPLLEDAFARVPADDVLREQLSGSLGHAPENRATELFAYLGTQVAPGDLDATLEATYGLFVSDRAALVAVHDAWTGMLDGMTAELDAASIRLWSQEQAAAFARTAYEGDAATTTSYREAYAAKVAEVQALPERQRDGLRLAWTWSDGTELPMASADVTLAAAAALLARDEAALATREMEVVALEEAAASERARVDDLAQDLAWLDLALDPYRG